MTKNLAKVLMAVSLAGMFASVAHAQGGSSGGGWAQPEPVTTSPDQNGSGGGGWAQPEPDQNGGWGGPGG